MKISGSESEIKALMSKVIPSSSKIAILTRSPGLPDARDLFALRTDPARAHKGYLQYLLRHGGKVRKVVFSGESLRIPQVAFHFAL